jgi:hypothetical protein
MWFVAGFIAGPVATLIHESGHYLTALILGLPGAVLHVSWVSYNRSSEIRALLQAGQREQAAHIAALWKVALTDAGGPMVSILLLGAAILCRQRWLLASAAAAIAAGWRFSAPAGVAGALVLRAMIGNRQPLGANVDEFNAARALNVNPLLVILPVLCVVGYGLVALALAIPRAGRLRWSAALCAGLAIGLVLYLNVVGPLIFP